MTDADTKKIVATGRRKEATARVHLMAGKGRITVNGKELESYLSRFDHRQLIWQPFEITGCKGKFDVLVNVRGGGASGQAEAIRHGIARALSAIDESNRRVLRKKGFLTRDPRVKERKKYGQKGARKRFQWTKR